MKRFLLMILLLTLCCGLVPEAGAAVWKDPAETFPAGVTKTFPYSVESELKTGTGRVYGVTACRMKNGTVHFAMDYDMPKGMNISVFSPPNGKVFSGKVKGRTTGERSVMEFDLTEKEIVWSTYCTIKFYTGGEQNVYWVFLDLDQLLPERKSMKFSEENELTKGTGKIHSVTVCRMTDGSVHFSVDYSMIKGMNISYFSPPHGDAFMYRGQRTSGERSLLEFDLTEKELAWSDSCTVKFYNGNASSNYWLFLDLSQFQPKLETMRYSAENELNSGTGQIHGVTSRRMTDGSVHFTVDYSMPKGMNISYFSPPRGDAFMYRARRRTDGNRGLLEFDLTLADILGDDSCTINFYTGDRNRYMVFLDLNQFKPALKGTRHTLQSVRLYAEASTSSKVVATLGKDREVTLLDEDGPWSRVCYSQNNKKMMVGYVLTEAIRR